MPAAGTRHQPRTRPERHQLLRARIVGVRVAGIVKHHQRTRRGARHHPHVHALQGPGRAPLDAGKKRARRRGRQLHPARRIIQPAALPQRRRVKDQPPRGQAQRRRQRRAGRAKRVARDRVHRPELRRQARDDLRQQRHARLLAGRIAMRRAVEGHHPESGRHQRHGQRPELRAAAFPAVHEDDQRPPRRAPRPRRQPARRGGESETLRRLQIAFLARRAPGARRPQVKRGGQLAQRRLVQRTRRHRQARAPRGLDQVRVHGRTILRQGFIGRWEGLAGAPGGKLRRG